MKAKVVFAMFMLSVLTLIGMTGFLYYKTTNELNTVQNTINREIQVNDQILRSIQKQYNQTPPTAVEQGILL